MSKKHVYLFWDEETQTARLEESDSDYIFGNCFRITYDPVKTFHAPFKFTMNNGVEVELFQAHMYVSSMRMHRKGIDLDITGGKPFRANATRMMNVINHWAAKKF